MVVELFHLVLDVEHGSDEVAARFGHFEFLQNGDNNDSVLPANAPHLFDSCSRIIKVVEGSEAKNDVKGGRSEGQALTLAIYDATMRGLGLGYAFEEFNGRVEAELVSAVKGREGDSSTATDV